MQEACTQPTRLLLNASQYLFDLFDVFLLRVALLSLGDELVRGALLLLLLPPHELLCQVGISERIDVVRVPTETNAIRASRRAEHSSQREDTSSAISEHQCQFYELARGVLATAPMQHDASRQHRSLLPVHVASPCKP